jgi:L,D-transpeptidase ErfK/SrfK
MIRNEKSSQGVRHGLTQGSGIACATLVGLGLAIGAQSDVRAETFRLAHPGDSVIGAPFYVKTRKKDTLLDFARQNNQGYDDMNKANPRVDMWLPGEGSEALIPSFWVLPNIPRSGIVLNRAEKRLYYFPPEDPDRIETYAISVGKDGWETPLGTYSIIEKKKDPTWTPPESVRQSHAEYGDILPPVVPAGPDNPLGQYAMRLSNPSYLIHGTNKPWGMGLPVSSGCIRMQPEGIEDLFGKVETGTQVTIVDQPYKLGWLGDDLYLEVHIDKEEKRQSPRSVIPESVASAEGLTIDWKAVERAVSENTGLPQLVGSRRSSAERLHLDMIF